MRFLVRAGNGAKVTPFVGSATVLVLETNREERTQSWRKEHNLSIENQLRLKEWYVRKADHIYIYI